MVFLLSHKLKPSSFISDGYNHLINRILNGSITSSPISLLLSCVDNYAARTSINMTCNQYDQIWIESGVSEDAISSHIQIMVPGQTACFLCATPLAIVENNEDTIKREGVCAASLPTTMGITAGFMAQNALKLLLEFGDLAFCLSYNAKMDFFQNYKIWPNPECKDKECKKKQEEKKGKEGFLEKREKKNERKRKKGKD